MIRPIRALIRSIALGSRGKPGKSSISSGSLLSAAFSRRSRSRARSFLSRFFLVIARQTSLGSQLVSCSAFCCRLLGTFSASGYPIRSLPGGAPSAFGGNGSVWPLAGVSCASKPTKVPHALGVASLTTANTKGGALPAGLGAEDPWEFPVFEPLRSVVRRQRRGPADRV